MANGNLGLHNQPCTSRERRATTSPWTYYNSLKESILTRMGRKRALSTGTEIDP